MKYQENPYTKENPANRSHRISGRVSKVASMEKKTKNKAISFQTCVTCHLSLAKQVKIVFMFKYLDALLPGGPDGTADYRQHMVKTKKKKKEKKFNNNKNMHKKDRR